MSKNQGKRWLSLSDVAKLLGVHEGTVRRWADAGRLPFFRTPGGHRRFLAQDVAAFLDGSRTTSDSPVQQVESQLLTVVRNDISQHIERQSWYPYFDSSQAAERKDTGRRLLGMFVHYISHAVNGDQYLHEAKTLMQKYGREAVALGMGLKDMVQAYLFFRRSLSEAVSTSAQGDDPHSPQLIGRMNQFWDDLLLAMIEGYTEAHPTITG